MNKRTIDYERLYIDMEEELVKIELLELSPQAMAYQSMLIVRLYLVQLKTNVVSAGFSSDEEEIHFFKFIKPKFFSRFLYYAKVARLLLRWPPAGHIIVEQLLHKELEKLNYFFQKHISLYEYYRSGATFLDNHFFTRQHTSNNHHLPADLDNFGVDNDPLFTTGYDFLIAKISANDLYRKFIEEELAKLSNPIPQLTEGGTGKVVWTASKAALVELLYALQGSGVFNYGKATLNEVALFIEQVFGIKLGNYYRVFQEIRIRKKSRTQFLDEIKDRLVQKMDYWDENPHVS